MKNIVKKHREAILYLVFGVATTAVSWVVYFSVMWGGRTVFSVSAHDATDAGYLALYTAAQIISWITAVLFAFYTNRRWVFTDADTNIPAMRQLAIFASGRLATFVLDYAVTIGATVLLGSVLPALNSFFVPIIEKNMNLNEIAAKLLAAVIVFVGNYIFSKLFVFKKNGNVK